MDTPSVVMFVWLRRALLAGTVVLLALGGVVGWIVGRGGAMTEPVAVLVFRAVNAVLARVNDALWAIRDRMEGYE